MESYQLGPAAANDFRDMRRRHKTNPSEGRARFRRVRWPDDSGGTGLPLIRYEITSPDCADGSALAVITAVSCDVTSPAVGDEITLLDEDGWFSGETNATLNGRTGTAHKFNIPSGYDDCSYVIITISPAPYEC